MFEFKIKTLDGRNHDFTAEDDTTVSQLKVQIHERLNIEIERQRLLFCGHALDDDQVLSSLDLEGNVMHLVTRLPPSQTRQSTDTTNTNQEEPNSDHNREQIRNIISDLLQNIGDYSNVGNVSVNNEGSRMDITVNIPSQNRLSLARLRYNYQQRLLSQSRSVLNYLRNSNTESIPMNDHERLYQSNPYDIGENEERLIDLSSEPLPVHFLADMIDDVLSIWNDSDDALRNWQRVLRRDSTDNLTASEQQRVHDTSSRLIHLFAHMLHIMSDYLVEFNETRSDTTRTASTATCMSTTRPTQTTATTETSTTVNLDDEAVPLTSGCGESAAVSNTESSNTSTTSAAGAGAARSTHDRSQYLYVFSEVPAQVVQVRLDVDSDSPDFQAIANHIRQSTLSAVSRTGGTTTTPASTTPPTTRSSSMGPPQSRTVPINPFVTTTATPTSQFNAQTSGNTDTSTQETPTDARANTSTPLRANYRRFEIFEPLSVPGLTSNFFRAGPRTGASRSRPIASTTTSGNSGGSGPVDPYCRCHSRHFQPFLNQLSSMSGSTIGGRTRRTTQRTTATNTSNARQTRSNTTGPTRPTESTRQPPRPTVHNTNMEFNRDSMGNMVQSLIGQIFSGSNRNEIGTATTRAFLNQFSSEFFGRELSRLRVLPRLMNLILDHLTLPEIMLILSGHITEMRNGPYTQLNELRRPLQNQLLDIQHQLCGGSRERLIELLINDMEELNQSFYEFVDELRNDRIRGVPVVPRLRGDINRTIDIRRTTRRFVDSHVRSMVDLVFRSPTDIGFGQLITTAFMSFLQECMILVELLCGENSELRSSMIAAMIRNRETVPGVNLETGSPNVQIVVNSSFDISQSLHGLFNRPSNYEELKRTFINNYVVNINEDTNNEADARMETTETMIISGDENLRLEPTDLDEAVAMLTDTGMVLGRADEPIESGIFSTSAINGESGISEHIAREWDPQITASVMANDTQLPVNHSANTRFSEAYLAGMPPKRRRVAATNQNVGSEGAAANHNGSLSSPESIMYNLMSQAISEVAPETVNPGNVISAPPTNRDLEASFRQFIANSIEAHHQPGSDHDRHPSPPNN